MKVLMNSGRQVNKSCGMVMVRNLGVAASSDHQLLKFEDWYNRGIFTGKRGYCA